jgi:hypothetical protein
MNGTACDRRRRADTHRRHPDATIFLEAINMNIEQQLQEIQQRNFERAKQAILKLGEKYLCHPSNRVQRKTPKQVLSKGTS